VPTREVVVVRHQLRYQTKGAELFLQMLRNEVAELTRSGKAAANPPA
jgi:hypothetical protein